MMQAALPCNFSLNYSGGGTVRKYGWELPGAMVLPGLDRRPKQPGQLRICFANNVNFVLTSSTYIEEMRSEERTDAVGP